MRRIFRAPEHLFQSEDAIELLAQLLEALEMGWKPRNSLLGASLTRSTRIWQEPKSRLR